MTADGAAGHQHAVPPPAATPSAAAPPAGPRPGGAAGEPAGEAAGGAGPGPGRLSLPEELLLLALDGASGRRLRPTELDPGLAGAALLELVLRGHLDVRDARVVVLDPGPTGDVALDALLTRVTASGRRRTARHWVSTQRGLRRAVSERLVTAGSLRRSETRLLGPVRLVRFPTADPAAERAVRTRLEDAVLHGVAPDERTAALAALVSATALRRAAFPGADRRTTRGRLAELSHGEWASAAVRRAVRDVQVATAAAAVAAGSTGST